VKTFLIVCVGLVFGVAGIWVGGAYTGESAAGDSPVAEMGKEGAAMEKATFAAGCFWGVEAAFRGLDGVVSTQVGYTGGKTENPTYREVCGHSTGHAEAVELVYDQSRISYGDLLDVFWEIHNPTTRDRQGFDVGSQYRSAIFYHTPEQKKTAIASKEAMERSGKYGKRPLVTQIVPAGEFYRAEEYHQQYYEKRGRGGCAR
jgi:peptide-methionine (S)-S-oxide reductase